MLKNLTLYTVTAGWPASLTELETALNRLPFQHLEGHQDKALGWVSPRGQAHGPLAESVQGQWMLRFMAETRQVPSSVVQRKLEEACAHIEATSGRKPGRKEQRDLKDSIRESLLPQAFPRMQSTWVWLDPVHHRLVVDSTSSGRCDDILTTLVKVLDGFVAEPVQTPVSPAVVMSLWLTEQAESGSFQIGQACELKSADEGQAAVRYTRHPLLTDEIKQHITQGKQPTQLALNWLGRVDFVLSDTLQLKRLAFDDSVLEQASAQNQRADDFDGNVLMSTAELMPLLDDLLQALQEPSAT